MNFVLLPYIMKFFYATNMKILYLSGTILGISNCEWISETKMGI